MKKTLQRHISDKNWSEWMGKIEYAVERRGGILIIPKQESEARSYE
jgi:hypothetical protein